MDRNPERLAFRKNPDEVGFEETLAQINRKGKIGLGNDKCSNQVCGIFKEVILIATEKEWWV